VYPGVLCYRVQCVVFRTSGVSRRRGDPRRGLISLQDYFKSIECERNMITDCLLELLEIEHGTFEFICETYAQDDKRTISKFVIVSNLSSLF
jgi:hypothetical protein